MAKFEVVMVSASPAAVASTLGKLPGFRLDSQDGVTTRIIHRGALIAVESNEDEDGIYEGRTTSLDVYGRTQEDALARAEDLYGFLKDQTDWGLAMHFNELDIPQWSRHEGS